MLCQHEAEVVKLTGCNPVNVFVTALAADLDSAMDDY